MKGFEAASRIVKENAEKMAQYEKDKAEGRIKPMGWPCYIKGGEEADLSFVSEDEPTILLVHKIGERYTPRVCLGNNCPYCSTKNNNKASYRAFFTVVDHRERTYTSRDNLEVTTKDNLRYLEMSTAQCEALSTTLKKNKIKNITVPVINVTKSGSGKSTTTQFFTVDREDHHGMPESIFPYDFESMFTVSPQEAMKEAMSGEIAKYE